jgi:hypothetical protein
VIEMPPGCNSGTVLQLGKPALQRHRHAPADRQTGSNRTGSIPPSAAGASAHYSGRPVRSCRRNFAVPDAIDPPLVSLL